jgi:putative oxidoreductase
MTQRTDLAALAARLCLAPLFLSATVDKIRDVRGLEAYLTGGGLPEALAWPVIALELTLGLAILTGVAARSFALIGAAFCLATAVLFHFDLADWLQRTMFLKNLGLAGGFLLLAAMGPGRYVLRR